MSTAQQIALAIGATGIGTLFLSLSSGPFSDHAGRSAVVAVLAIQGAVAGGGALLSRWLPEHGRA
jgi:hypothetical protein